MKKWTTPTVNELAINETQNEWEIQPTFDGGYLGDGKLSGWFGDDDKDNGSGTGNAPENSHS